MICPSTARRTAVRSIWDRSRSRPFECAATRNTRMPSAAPSRALAYPPSRRNAAGLASTARWPFVGHAESLQARRRAKFLPRRARRHTDLAKEVPFPWCRADPLNAQRFRAGSGISEAELADPGWASFGGDRLSWFLLPLVPAKQIGRLGKPRDRALQPFLDRYARLPSQPFFRA